MVEWVMFDAAFSDVGGIPSANIFSVSARYVNFLQGI